MADRNIVIKSIENCLHEKGCDDCSYEGCIHAHGNCTGDLMAAALELLKEQPEIVRCKDCKHATMTADGRLCKYCDLAENDDGSLHEVYYNADWYCPCGEVEQDDP